MATVESAHRALPRSRRPPTSDILRWIFGATLLIGFGWWLIQQAVESPSRFIEVTLIGITNGSIYALVALGYTLVYGIIELINFAHGDNFMLGTFQTQSMINQGSFQIPLLFFTIAIPLATQGDATSATAHKVCAVGSTLFLCLFFCLVINVTIYRVSRKPLLNQP